MGVISRKLANRFERDSGALRRFRKELEPDLHAKDRSPDPVHAAYVRAQNLTATFAENASGAPELEPYAKLASEAMEEYVPGGPPMSPLTHSYFTTWAFFDLRFGRDHETIGTVLLDVGEQLRLPPALLTVIRQFQQTRMGIYEVCDVAPDRTRLRELITDKEVNCFVSSRYLGKKDQLWYVRLCPPIPGHDYHVAFTTPYVLLNPPKAEWTAYLERAMKQLDGDDRNDKLHRLLKFGLHPNGWNEYVFQAYVNYQTEAAFLKGLPDQPESRPHADTTGKRRCG